MHEGSLASKLFHLRVGETVYIDDVFSPGKATRMERAVQTAMLKTPQLKERKVVTERWCAAKISPAEARQILSVTRVV